MCAEVLSSKISLAGSQATLWGNRAFRSMKSGQERDAETGSDYFKARYYGNLLGRFTSPDPDPGSMDVTNPQSFNRYAYVLGNPMRNVDPSGDCTVGDDGVARDDTPGDCGGGSVTVDGGAPPPVDLSDVLIYYDSPYGGGATFSVTTTITVMNPGQRRQPGKTGTKVHAACLADVALNFGLGFVPGFNGFKLAMDIAGYNLHPFGQMADGSNIATFDFGGLSTFSGFADIGRNIANISYASAGGTVALSRATNLVQRASFAGKSAAQQAKLLRNLSGITKLANIASVAGGVANVLNVASSVSDAYDCFQKQ